MLKRFAATVFVVGLATFPLRAEIVEQVLVRVNGDILTKSDFEQRQIAALRGRPELANVSPSSPELKKAVEEITPNLILDAVDELLLAQRGRELGYTMSDDQFKGIIDNIKKQNADSIKTDADLERALKEAGLTMAKLRQNFEKAYFVFEVERREVARNITLTEEEARQYYKAHPQEFMKPATVTLREILVSVPVQGTGAGATFQASAADAAKVKIDAVRARAAAGEDFLKLISEVSDSGTKANNGLIGPVAVEELNPLLAAALEKMQPGDVSEALRSRAGYQIFKLEARSAVEPEPFDKVREDIARKIYESRRDVEMAKYFTKLRGQALIEWKDENFRKMYEQGFAKGKTGF